MSTSVDDKIQEMVRLSLALNEALRNHRTTEVVDLSARIKALAVILRALP